MTHFILERSLTARDFCVAMWWASKAGIAQADIRRHKQGSFMNILDGNFPSTATQTTCKTSTSTRSTRRHFKETSIAEWFDDEVEIDGTMIYKLEEAKSQNNLSPRYWSHNVVLDNPSASILPSAFYPDGVPYSHDDSVIGFWVVNVPTQGRYFVAAVRKKLLCQSGRRGWCTFLPLFEMLRWRCSAMAEGMRPSSRHDGKGWLPMDVRRESLSGRPLNVRGAVLFSKGDWSEYGTLGFTT